MALQKERGGGGSSFISRAAITDIPFLGLSLLRNQREKLATQANIFLKKYIFIDLTLDFLAFPDEF